MTAQQQFLLFLVIFVVPISNAFRNNILMPHAKVIRLPSQQHLFGFGKEEATSNDGELAIICNVASNAGSSIESLSDYLMEWSKLLESGGMGLTTPVKVSSLDDDISNGVRILFQPTKTGSAYISKKDEHRMEDEEEKDDDNDEVPELPKKDGGVDICIDVTDDNKLDIRAKRCEIEEGTIIKEMSEETIVQELNKAIKIWKKQHEK
mmetsp:Transcript_8535/g.12361  ORF Transcript_8535/g.12361 Transcript_8535/m.12361 type:complete len:207 (+) Transcript_8535:121-741(+)